MTKTTLTAKVALMNQTAGTHWTKMPLNQEEIDAAWDYGMIHRVGAFFFVGRG